MSGGALNYIAYKDVDEILSRSDDLETIISEIRRLDQFSIAADHTEEILNAIMKAKRLIEERGKLDSVWHAVEWKLSGDSGDDRILKAAQEYKESLKS